MSQGRHFPSWRMSVKILRLWSSFPQYVLQESGRTYKSHIYHRVFGILLCHHFSHFTSQGCTSFLVAVVEDFVLFFAFFSLVWSRVFIYLFLVLLCPFFIPKPVNQFLSLVSNEIYKNSFFLFLGYFHKVLFEHEYCELATVMPLLFSRFSLNDTCLGITMCPKSSRAKAVNSNWYGV